MSDQGTNANLVNQGTVNAGDAASAATQDEGTKPEPQFTQEDLNRILAREKSKLEAKYSDAITKATEYDKIADQQKTAEQRAAEQMAEMQRKFEATAAENVRLTLATEHSIGKDYLGLIGSGTPEEMAANASALSAILQENASLKSAQTGAPAPKPKTPVGDLLSGSTPQGTGSAPNGAAGAAEAARRFGAPPQTT